jgi:dienelactone hydrolase
MNNSVKFFMKNLIFCCFVLLSVIPASAQSLVKVDYSIDNGATIKQLDAVLRSPEGEPNKQGLLILHHGGGFSLNTTQQYGEFFAKQGFVTLELKMFNEHKDTPDPTTLHAFAMGGLKYLSKLPGVDPKRVSAMGMSLGAFLTVDSASTWFYDQYQGGDLRFHKLAALYPVCWLMTEAAKGQPQGIRPFTGLPSSFLQKWEGIPLLILAAGKDSYDSQDSTACGNFVQNINDTKQAQVTKVEVFENTTHGWDHGKNYSFPVRGGCTGRTNCTNITVYSPTAVDKGKQSVLSFLKAP